MKSQLEGLAAMFFRWWDSPALGGCRRPTLTPIQKQLVQEVVSWVEQMYPATIPPQKPGDHVTDFTAAQFPALEAAWRYYKVARKGVIERLWEKAECDQTVWVAQVAEAAAQAELGRAFYKDTSDYNRLENCLLMTIPKFEELAKRKRGTK